MGYVLFPLIIIDICQKGDKLAQPNFQFEKRQKELAKKKKKEEKKQRKLEESALSKENPEQNPDQPPGEGSS